MFDIRWLVERYQPDEETRDVILKTLLEKSDTRDIEPKQDSFNNPEVRERSAREWETMILEIGANLPDFEESFNIVHKFYHSLPWK
ncbi:nucleotidyl transferase AbiEii/AbiGii toxin family protein [Neorhizobium sp. T7_12]|uniref:nucleotidyl transferase AbiEii/AbiGii toxin family protein n=1 Tax=Neorhizobium sp. T7_12 TaxID=2093832 RepID=UPI000CF8BC33|nr:nucleotidyl transferase AbiEii/AbiGii toxin family protein [Neorhizobium sp. T7_12]